MSEWICKYHHHPKYLKQLHFGSALTNGHCDKSSYQKAFPETNRLQLLRKFMQCRLLPTVLHSATAVPAMDSCFVSGKLSPDWQRGSTWVTEGLHSWNTCSPGSEGLWHTRQWCFPGSEDGWVKDTYIPAHPLSPNRAVTVVSTQILTMINYSVWKMQFQSQSNPGSTFSMSLNPKTS